MPFLYCTFYTQSWQVALLIGLTFALSSTAFVMQILQEKGQLYTKIGKSGFSILLMQDLAVVPLLALVPILAQKGELSQNHSLLEEIVIVFIPKITIRCCIKIKGLCIIAEISIDIPTAIKNIVISKPL